VTGSGFVTLAATLSAIPTVPVAGLALLIGIDRFMSEARAITNLIGNALAAVVVARWDNGLNVQQMTRVLNGESAPDESAAEDLVLPHADPSSTASARQSTMPVGVEFPSP
jgi:aerobic C4-dicarboxylate transport protein